MRAMTYATVSSAARTDVPGPEGSMIKVFYADLAQRIHRARMDVIGAHCLDRGGELRLATSANTCTPTRRRWVAERRKSSGTSSASASSACRGTDRTSGGLPARFRSGGFVEGYPRLCRFPLCPGPSRRLDDVTWKEIAQLDWFGLATDEGSGGAGATCSTRSSCSEESVAESSARPILTTFAAARLASWSGPTISA